KRPQDAQHSGHHHPERPVGGEQAQDHLDHAILTVPRIPVPQIVAVGQLLEIFHDQSRNGSVIRIVSSRSGLVLSRATGQPTSSSTLRTYLMQVAGSSAKERAPRVLSPQPSKVSHTGLSLACAPMVKGKRSIFLPSSS